MKWGCALQHLHSVTAGQLPLLKCRHLAGVCNHSIPSRPSPIPNTWTHKTCHTFSTHVSATLMKDWNVHATKMQEAISRILGDGLQLGDGDKEDLLTLFLYAKDVLSHYTPEARKQLFADVLGGKHPLILERLKKIVLAGEESSEVIPGKNTFTDFCNKCPDWADPAKSFVTFRDDVRLRETGLRERVQLSGLCYMHAPTVLQSYLVSKTTGKDNGMLDLAKFIRRFFGPKELEHHIFNDGGGSSEHFLTSVLQTKSGIKGYAASAMTDTDLGEARQIHQKLVVNNLRVHGPALIARFNVYRTFMDNGTIVHLGCDLDPTSVIGMHALLLVGHRYMSDGSDRYLVQNWWYKKPFFEADALYLSKCSASITFVTSPQDRIPEEFDVNYEHHVELELSMAERLPYEW